MDSDTLVRLNQLLTNLEGWTWWRLERESSNLVRLLAADVSDGEVSDQLLVEAEDLPRLLDRAEKALAP